MGLNGALWMHATSAVLWLARSPALAQGTPHHLLADVMGPSAARLPPSQPPLLNLAVDVDGRTLNLTFSPLEDLEAVARTFVRQHGLQGGKACADDNCMVDLIHREMMRVDGFRESHDAALGLTCHTDSTEYQLLVAARELIAREGVPGLTCEIGVRSGGSSELIMRTGVAVSDGTRRHVAIDPYGDLPYATTDAYDHHVVEARMGYTNEMRRQALRDLYTVAHELGVDLHTYDLEDIEFFSRFADGIPVYQNGSRALVNEYALVFFDGPHTFEALKVEMAFFSPRSPPGAVWVVDDLVELAEEGGRELHRLLTEEHRMERVAAGKWKALYRRRGWASLREERGV